MYIYIYTCKYMLYMYVCILIYKQEIKCLFKCPFKAYATHNMRLNLKRQRKQARLRPMPHTTCALRGRGSKRVSLRADLVLESVRGFRKACREGEKKESSEKKNREIRRQRSSFRERGGGGQREMRCAKTN